MFEIDLTWRDRSTTEVGFQIERSTDDRNFRQIAQVLPNTTIYRDKGLFPGTRYFYRIRAFNAAGESGYSSESARTPSPPVPLTIVTWYGTPASGTNAPDCVSLSGRFQHVLELKKEGTVAAWGDNTYGQATVPTNLTGVVAIAAGNAHSLALREDGTVVGWGDPAAAAPPVDLSGVVAISSGYAYSLALKGDGTVVGWGDNSSGQATPPTNLVGVVAIAAGWYHSLALKSDGTIVAWGNPSGGATILPTNLTSVIAIAAGLQQSFAVNNDGTVLAWGINGFGVARPPTNLTGVAAIASAASYTLALGKDGTLTNWGQPAPYGPTYLLPDLGGAAISVSILGFESAALSLSPASPSDAKAVVLAANQIQLSWRDNSSHEQGFRIERTPLNVLPSPWTEIAVVGPNKTNYIDSTLTTNVYYAYRVRAYSHFGTSPYSPGEVVVTTPLAAPYFANVALGTNGVNVTWAYAYGGVDGFKIERALDNNGAPGAWTEIASTNPVPFVFQFTDTNVQTNTIYWYRVRAFNILGLSPSSDPVSIGTILPPAPQSFSGYALVDQAHVFWDADQTLTEGVTIERAPDISGNPGTWVTITNFGPLDDSYVDGGLPANTIWWYRVRAFNWIGYSPYTSPISIAILPPEAPQLGSVSIGPSNNVQLVAYEQLVEPDGFEFDRAPDVNGSPGSWVQIAMSSPADPSGYIFSDTNIVINDTYWYRVRAFNVLGYSDYSTAVSISIVPPMDPLSLTASTLKNQVSLNWDFSGTSEVGFILQRAPDAGGIPGNWAQIATFPVSGYSFGYYTDSNLTANATYWYRVQAFDWVGNGPFTDPVMITIVPPPAPSALSAVLGTTNQVNLFWAASLQYVDGFYVEVAPSAGGEPGTWKQIATVPPGTISADLNFFTDTNVVANTTNWYRVRAFSIVGVSDYSAPTSIAILPPGIPNFAANGVANRALLDWNEDSETDSETASYVIERAPDLDGSPGSWTEIAATLVGVFDFTDRTGIAGMTAWYRVQARTWVGSSPFSDPMAVTFAVPSDPSSPDATLGTTNQLDLILYDDSQDEDGLTIERAPDTNGIPGQWVLIGTIFATNASAVAFIDTNVIANTTNWYRTRAFTGNDVSSYSDPAQFSIVPPVAPELWLTPLSDSIDLSWSDSEYYNITQFGIQRAPDSNGIPGSWLGITNISNTASNISHTDYTDFDRLPGTTAWYRICAYNWVGQSPFSDALAGSIAPVILPPPQFLSLLATNNDVHIFWSTVGGATDTVQAAGSLSGIYSNISAALPISGSGNTTTDYLDAGALTNASSRFYRIQRAP
jgi:titin